MLAQRLLRKLCASCKIKVPANAGETEMLKRVLAEIPAEAKTDLPKTDFELFRASEAGCKDCGGKAYKGRIGIFETLEMTDELERIVLGDISEAKLRAEAKRQGMLTMYQDGIIKVLKGTTSIEELLQVAQEQEEEPAEVPASGRLQKAS